MAASGAPEVPPLKSSFFYSTNKTDATGASFAPQFLATPHSTFQNPFTTNFRKQQTLVASSHGSGVSTYVGEPKKSSRGPMAAPTDSVPLSAGTVSATQRTDVSMMESVRDVTDGREAVPATRGTGRETIICFEAYFQESVPESGAESSRYRHVVLKFFVDDGTLLIREKSTPNSGLPVGNILRRQRVPKGADSSEMLTPLDFNVGKDVSIFAITYHIATTDDYTRDYYQSHGIVVPPNEELPENAYDRVRESLELHAALHPREGGFDTSFVRFLQDDRKVLRFYGAWDDRLRMGGRLHFLSLRYFVTDGSIEVAELEPAKSASKERVATTSGKSSTLVRRQRLPKSLKTLGETSGIASLGAVRSSGREAIAEAFVGLDELRLGATIDVLGRSVFLHDADEFTRLYLMSSAIGRSADEMKPIELEYLLPEAEGAKLLPTAPYNGFGSEEDSMQNVKSVHAKPPRKDYKKFLESSVAPLKFRLRLDTSSYMLPSDRDREFVLRYYLGDEAFEIQEKEMQGGFGGHFLRRSRVHRPESRTAFYCAEDLSVGKKLTVTGREFVLMECDAATTKFLAQFDAASLQDYLGFVIAKIHDVCLAAASGSVAVSDLKGLPNPLPVDDLFTFLGARGLALGSREFAAVCRAFELPDHVGHLDGVALLKAVFPSAAGADSSAIESSSSSASSADPKLAAAQATARETKRLKDTMKSLHDLVFYSGKHVLAKLREQDTMRKGSLPLVEVAKVLSEQFGYEMDEAELSLVMEPLGFRPREPIPYDKWLAVMMNVS